LCHTWEGSVSQYEVYNYSSWDQGVSYDKCIVFEFAQYTLLLEVKSNVYVRIEPLGLCCDD